MNLKAQARRFREAARGARWIGGLRPAERTALAAVAGLVAREHVEARAAPSIDPTAIISPLASLRFVENLTVGPRATIGPYCCIWGGWEQAQVTVGAGALLAPGVVVAAGNHRIAGRGWIRDAGFDEADAGIGVGAWVGAHATIVGAHVGEGAVVAANAVVTQDVPPFAVAAGVPARVVGWREGAAPAPD